MLESRPDLSILDVQDKSWTPLLRWFEGFIRCPPLFTTATKNVELRVIYMYNTSTRKKQMLPLTKTLFLVSITLSLVGCNGNLKGDYDPTKSSSFEYLDSGSFDNTLSTNMSGEHAKIEVAFPTPFSSSNIPSRVDAWLTTIQKTGGEVKTEAAQGERDLGSVIISLYGIYQQIQKARRYLPAHNYNAKLLYRQNESGEAMIEKIVFTHK